jgi:hypothetical protein
VERGPQDRQHRGDAAAAGHEQQVLVEAARGERAGRLRSTSSVLPATTSSHNQFEPYPSATRLTVIFGFSSSSGELDSE